MKIKKLSFEEIWNSTTLMTWLSYFAKSSSLLLILPLTLKRLSTPEIAVWYFFSALISMSGLADFGFKNTFIRLFALGYGGAKDIGIFKQGVTKQHSEGQTNWKLIEQLFSSMQSIYLYISLVVALLLFALGSASLIKPISAVSNHTEAWISWIIIALAIIFNFYGTIYSNYLEGLFKIAMVKRIEFLFRIGGILTSFIVLLTVPSLLNLVIANASWMIINVFRNYILARYICEKKLISFKSQPFEKDFFLKIWRPAWRGGISGLMSHGLTNLSGILYAQVGSPAAVASYMIALRIITEIRNFSNAPFYSKIPLMVKLRAENSYTKLIQVAQRGMMMSHLVFALGAVFVGLFFNHFLIFIGSKIHFVEPQLWLLMSIAFYTHRYGALHMQLYVTTNHVISHIADTIGGILFLASSLMLVHYIGIYAIPVGMLVGYLCFYAWFAAYHSLKSINFTFFKFEYRASALPALVFAIYTIISLIMIYYSSTNAIQ